MMMPIWSLRASMHQAAFVCPQFVVCSPVSLTVVLGVAMSNANVGVANSFSVFTPVCLS